jgi:hypothetical protein
VLVGVFRGEDIEGENIELHQELSRRDRNILFRRVTRMTKSAWIVWFLCSIVISNAKTTIESHVWDGGNACCVEGEEIVDTYDSRN